MTSLQQTALDFCRECLGWEVRKATVKSIYSTDATWLDFKDLNAVLLAVRGWCGTHQLTLVVTSQLPMKMFRWRVQIMPDSYTLDNDLAHALMSACVATNRQMKGISHD